MSRVLLAACAVVVLVVGCAGTAPTAVSASCSSSLNALAVEQHSGGTDEKFAAAERAALTACASKAEFTAGVEATKGAGNGSLIGPSMSAETYVAQVCTDFTGLPGCR